MRKRVFCLVITGGPCGGKTSSFPFLKKELERRGYKVLYVPEAASELTTVMGAEFKDIPTNEFQDLVVKHMLFQENEVYKLSEYYSQDVIILFDRSYMDNMAYMAYNDFLSLMSNNNLAHQEIMNRFDAVFHLITAALGAEKYYHLEGSRHETPAEARELDIKTMEAWLHHPKHILIDNSTDFDGKLKRLLNKILEVVK